MIRAAIIGLGWWGQTILKTLKNGEIIAPVLGVDPERAGPGRGVGARHRRPRRVSRTR